MYFTKWLHIQKNNKELFDTCLEIQQNFIKEYLDEEDTSVGMYSIDCMSKEIAKDINDNVEGCRVLEGWRNWEFDLVVDEKYVLVIESVKRGFDDGGWEITNAFTMKEYDMLINEDKYMKEYYDNGGL